MLTNARISYFNRFASAYFAQVLFVQDLLLDQVILAQSFRFTYSLAQGFRLLLRILLRKVLLYHRLSLNRFTCTGFLASGYSYQVTLHLGLQILMQGYSYQIALHQVLF